jgi:hypothetical protein
MQTKREKKFRNSFEKMEGFSFATPVTGLNRPNTGKEDDDDDNISTQKYCFRVQTSWFVLVTCRKWRE